MSQNPESVPFVRRALQISRPDELWSTLAGHAAVANRYSYSICFTWVRQVEITTKNVEDDLRKITLIVRNATIAIPTIMKNHFISVSFHYLPLDSDLPHAHALYTFEFVM